MTFQPCLIIQRQPRILYLTTLHTNKTIPLHRRNRTNPRQGHIPIKLMLNQPRINSIGKHPYNIISQNHHNILYHDHILNLNRILIVPDKHVLFLLSEIGYFSHHCAVVMVEQNHDVLRDVGGGYSDF